MILIDWAQLEKGFFGKIIVLYRRRRTIVFKCCDRYLLLLLNSFFSQIEAYQGDGVKFIWQGNHSIHETKISEYVSEDIST